jgi:hypothetical protein
MHSLWQECHLYQHKDHREPVTVSLCSGWDHTSISFMLPAGLLLRSQNPTSGFYSDPVESSTPHSCEMHFNIVARTWRLYKTGIGLTTGFIRHS